VGVAKLVKAPGCGPGDRGFESHRPPHLFDYHNAPVAQWIERLASNQEVAGSTPAGRTINQLYKGNFNDDLFI
jgi:hypothetical protein